MKTIFSPEDKARIALAAYQGTNSFAELASKYKAHPIQIGGWKKKLGREAHTIFDNEQSESKKILALTEQLDEANRLIGVRESELVWLKKKLGT